MLLIMIKKIADPSIVVEILKISNDSVLDGDEFAQYPTSDFYKNCILNGYIYGNYLSDKLISFCYLGPDLRSNDIGQSSIIIDNDLHVGCLLTSVKFRGQGYGSELLASMPIGSWLRIDPINERSKAAALSGGYSVVGDCVLVSGLPLGDRLVLQKAKKELGLL